MIQTQPYTTNLRRLHLGMLCFIMGLALTGYSIYLREPLGIAQYKQPMVYVHAIMAYGFLGLLAIRVWAAIRSPGTLGLLRALPRVSDLKAVVSGRAGLRFTGRAPLSRLLSGALYLAFIIMALTGLVRAGTDLYFLPFGPIAQAYLAAPGVTATSLQPFTQVGVDAQHWHQVMAGKVMIGKVHIFCGFFILVIATFHALGAWLTAWQSGPARWMLFGQSRRNQDETPAGGGGAR